MSRIFQKIGESSIKTKTDNNGNANVSLPFESDDNDVTMILNKDGYSSGEMSL